MNPALENLDIWDKMNCRRFNSIMPSLHHKWTASVLNMEVNPEKGPDLIDDEKIVEVKFTLLHPEKKYPYSWTVMEHQMNYQNGRIGFWALGTYRLEKEVKDISEEEIGALEERVIQRELFIVPWNWMQQYPPSETRGETEYSRWSNTFRYPKRSRLPQIASTLEVEKGIVHLVQGVKAKYFKIRTKEIPF